MKCISLDLLASINQTWCFLGWTVSRWSSVFSSAYPCGSLYTGSGVDNFQFSMVISVTFVTDKICFTVPKFDNCTIICLHQIFSLVSIGTLKNGFSHMIRSNITERQIRDWIYLTDVFLQIKGSKLKNLSVSDKHLSHSKAGSWYLLKCLSSP